MGPPDLTLDMGIDCSVDVRQCPQVASPSCLGGYIWGFGGIVLVGGSRPNQLDELL